MADNGERMCHMRFTSTVRAVMTSMVLIIPRTNREKKGEKSERVAETRVEESLQNRLKSVTGGFYLYDCFLNLGPSTS